MTEPLTISDYKNSFFGGGTAQELEFYKQATDRGLTAFDLLNPASPRPSAACPWVIPSRGGASFAFPVNQMRLSRLWLPKGTITDACFEVISGDFGASTFVVLYDTSESDENHPGSLLVQTGVVSSDIAGIKTVALPSPVELEYEGWYWASAINTGAAASLLYGGGELTQNVVKDPPSGNVLRSTYSWRSNNVTVVTVPNPWVEETFDINSPTVGFKYAF